MEERFDRAMAGMAVLRMKERNRQEIEQAIDRASCQTRERISLADAMAKLDASWETRKSRLLRSLRESPIDELTRRRT